MSSTLATLILAAALTAQHPTAGSPAAPALSAEEVARLESAASEEHSPGHIRVRRARARVISALTAIRSSFRRCPIWLRRSFTTPSPTRMDTRFISGALDEDSPAKMVSTGKGRCTCPFFHPERQVDLVCLDPPEPQHRGRALQGPGV